METQADSIESLQLELDALRKSYHDLQIKEERYRLLTEHARDVIWTQKLDGTITYLSPAVEVLRGLTVEEAMVQPVDKILTPDSLIKVVMYLQEQYSNFTAGLPLKSFRGELDYYRKDGSILSTEVITYPIPGKTLDEVIILGVTREITERKEFEAKLHAQAKELKTLNDTKDKFFRSLRMT
jgi:PAS domain S-box-containing protein